MAQKTTQRAAVIVEAPSLPANKDQPDAKRPKGERGAERVGGQGGWGARA